MLEFRLEDAARPCGGGRAGRPEPCVDDEATRLRKVLYLAERAKADAARAIADRAVTAVELDDQELLTYAAACGEAEWLERALNRAEGRL